MFYQPTDESVVHLHSGGESVFGGWRASVRETQKTREQAISKGSLSANKCRTKETICIQIKVYHLSLPMPVVH